jgi:Transposase DDE domain
MAIVPVAFPSAWPTNVAPLARLFAYTQTLGLEPHLHRAKRGISTLVLALVWLTLAWRGSGRPLHVANLADPLLAALLGIDRLPAPRTLHRSLTYFPARAVRAAVEASYRAELPRRTGRVWAALDAHQLPYWGRGQVQRLQKGWAGSHNRTLRGYRLYLAVDVATGQVITFLLVRGRMRDHRLLAVLARHLRRLLGRRLGGVVADCGFTSRASVAALAATRVPFILGFARSTPIKQRLAARTPQQRRWLRAGGAVRLGACPWDERLRLIALGARSATDHRGPWVYVTSLRTRGPQALAVQYRQRTRVEQVIAELRGGHDLDHLVSTRLAPNRVAVGFRLLARNLAIGQQFADAGARPAVIREPLACRATQVDGLGTFTGSRRTLVVTPLRATPRRSYPLPWTRRVVRYAA